MLALGRMLVLGAFDMFGRNRMSTFRMLGMGTTMRLAQLLRFFEVVTFAGDKGRGRKNQEHVEGFHRAP